MSYVLGGDYQPSPAVQPLNGNNANANRAKEAARAIMEQSPGSEWQIQDPVEADMLFARLEEIRTEMGALYDKLYASWNNKAPGAQLGYSGPPYKVRMAIQVDLDNLAQEETSLQRQIQELRWVLAPNDQDGDAEEDEEEQEDPTQPTEFEVSINGR